MIIGQRQDLIFLYGITRMILFIYYYYYYFLEIKDRRQGTIDIGS